MRGFVLSWWWFQQTRQQLENWKSFFQTKMLNFQLFRGLYAGSTPALVANVSENSCLFAARGLTQVSERALTQISGIGKETASDIRYQKGRWLRYQVSERRPTQVSGIRKGAQSGIGKGADSGVSSFDRNSLNYRASLPTVYPIPSHP